MHGIIRGTSDHDAVSLAHRAGNVPLGALKRGAQIGAAHRIDLLVRKLRSHIAPCQQVAHLLARLGEARAIRHRHNDRILRLARAVRASLFLAESGRQGRRLARLRHRIRAKDHIAELTVARHLAGIGRQLVDVRTERRRTLIKPPRTLDLL